MSLSGIWFEQVVFSAVDFYCKKYTCYVMVLKTKPQLPGICVNSSCECGLEDNVEVQSELLQKNSALRWLQIVENETL